MSRAGSGRQKILFDVAKLLMVICGGAWLAYRATQEVGYNWQWYRVPRYLLAFENGQMIAGPLLNGLNITLRITWISMILSMVFGLVTALFRLSSSLLARAVSRVYLEIIRNTPLLVQLFFMYFVLAPILDLSRYTAAILSLSLFEGAYASEIFRAGILTIDRGQWEAGHSLGFNTAQCYRHIILPQGIRRMMPPLTGQAVSLIKDSALVSTIAIYDLTMQGQAIIAETFLAFEIWFTIAAMYLILTFSLSTGVYFMEKRFGSPSAVHET